MSYLKLYLLILLVIATVVTGIVSVRANRGQSSRAGSRNTATSVKPTAEVGPNRSGASRETKLALAARQNSDLSTELLWIFGGKQQRGWYLYTPLIQHLIGTQSDPMTESFAKALSSWQAKSGLVSNGILDDITFYKMISGWQARRLTDRTIATPDQLVVAPVSDFYHPSRPEELRQVQRDTYAAYKRMLAAAIADKSLGLSGRGNELAGSEKYLKIISAFRTPEYQESLRRQSPNAGRAGLAMNSPHFTGRALDLYVGGDPVETKDSNRAVQVKTPVYKWLVRNAERFGFRPYYYEPWHWEYVK